jgi:hypothetical protein
LANSSGLDTYIATGYASKYVQSNANHIWYNAPSGTADTSITFTQAMTLNASGDLLLNRTTTIDSAQFAINTTSGSDVQQGIVINNPYGFGAGVGTAASALTFTRMTSSTYVPVASVQGWNTDETSSNRSHLTFSTQTTVAGGLVERMRIDYAGNLGLGVTPSAWGTTNSVRALQLNSGALWSFSSTSLSLIQNAYYNGTNYIYSTTAASTRQDQAGGSHSWFTSPSGTAGTAVTYTERMRLDASGYLHLNTTGLSGATGYFEVDGDSALVRNLIATNNTASGTGTNAFVAFSRNGTYTGGISQTGTTSAFITSSDYRLKDNVAPMTGALDKVALLNPVTYTWKLDGSVGQGFIAHELAEVVPDCVTGEKDAVNEDGSIKSQGIDTSYLVATLTAAIQEQQALIENLTTRLAALENK